MDLTNTFTRTLWFESDEYSEESCLTISQCHIGDVGCVVWDAAISLIYYLESEHFLETLKSHFCDSNFSDLIALELGSGTGAVGLQIARKRIPTVITDLPQFISLMNLNIKNNIKAVHAPISAEALVWGNDSRSKVDILVISDCIYYEESIEPLIETVRELTKNSSLILLSYEDRSDTGKADVQRKFFQLAEEFLLWSEVAPCNLHEDYRCPEIHILMMWWK